MNKTCSTCKETKPLEDFPPNKKQKDGRSHHCRPCYSIYHREYYRERIKKDKEYKERKRRCRKQRLEAVRQKYRAHIKEYLQSHPCIQCGEKDFIVLDFDHIDPKTKVFAIGDGYSHWRPIQDLIDEIAKCQVLCANCHRRKTAKERNTWRVRV